MRLGLNQTLPPRQLRRKGKNQGTTGSCKAFNQLEQKRIIELPVQYSKQTKRGHMPSASTTPVLAYGTVYYDVQSGINVWGFALYRNFWT